MQPYMVQQGLGIFISPIRRNREEIFYELIQFAVGVKRHINHITKKAIRHISLRLRARKPLMGKLISANEDKRSLTG